MAQRYEDILGKKITRNRVMHIMKEVKELNIKDLFDAITAGIYGCRESDREPWMRRKAFVELRRVVNSLKEDGLVLFPGKGTVILCAFDTK